MKHITCMTASERDVAMQKRGLIYYRSRFRWGRMDAYRSADHTIIRFVDHNDILTPYELLRRLIDTWQPTTREDASYKTCYMRHELLALHRGHPMPHWDGPSSHRYR